MKVIWEYSYQSEAVRILAASFYIATGFYKEQRFLILPPERSIGGWHTSWFPDLPYHTIPGYWDQVKQINVNLPISSYPASLVTALSLMLSKRYRNSPQLSELKMLWQHHGQAVIAALHATFPRMSQDITQLVIHPSRFDTNASFTIPNRFPSQIEVWIREDQSLTSLVEAIVSALISHSTTHVLKAKWAETELLVDWLLFESPIAAVMSKIDPNYQAEGTIKAIRSSVSSQLEQESLTYQQYLGLPFASYRFSIKGGNILVNNVLVIGLTTREITILGLLIRAHGDVVTLDQLADTIFENDDDFLLSTQNKIIERLRGKLVKNHVPASCLKTIRGQGYQLVV